MKILAVSVLLVAMMALALGTEAPPVADAAPVTEAAIQQDKQDDDASPNEQDDDASPKVDQETESEDEDAEEAESIEGEKKGVVKRCVRGGWSRFGRKYYRFIPTARTWAQAQSHCRALGGNLASVHNSRENYWIRRLARGRPAWIGFSDAQQERYWFWVDGTAFNYRSWCRTEPNNLRRRENCALINWTARKCWNDIYCLARFPYVCERRRR